MIMELLPWFIFVRLIKTIILILDVVSVLKVMFLYKMSLNKAATNILVWYDIQFRKN